MPNETFNVDNSEALAIASQWFETRTIPEGWAVIDVDPEGDNFSDTEQYPLGALVAVGPRGDARYACGEPAGLLVRK